MLGCVVPVFVALCACSTDAIAPCSPEIISSLNDHACYLNEKPPSPLTINGVNFTMIYATPDVLGNNIKCLMGNQEKGYGVTYVTYNDNSKTVLKFSQELHETYYSETDNKGVMYKVFPVRCTPEFCMMYRCIDTEGVSGTGQPMFMIWTACGSGNDVNTEREVQNGIICSEKLKIANVKKVETCPC